MYQTPPVQPTTHTHSHTPGVGDLYTDPQIHTVTAEEYGEANLGAKGMALFFSSHICSPLCHYLGLSQFDLSEGEIQRLSSSEWKQTPQTVVASSASQTSGGNTLNGGREGAGRETVGQAFGRLSATWNLSELAEAPAVSLVPETPLTPSIPGTFESGDGSQDDGDGTKNDPSPVPCGGGDAKGTAAKVRSLLCHSVPLQWMSYDVVCLCVLRAGI